LAAAAITRVRFFPALLGGARDEVRGDTLCVSVPLPFNTALTRLATPWHYPEGPGDFGGGADGFARSLGDVYMSKALDLHVTGKAERPVFG
jgi:hypothetical protein